MQINPFFYIISPSYEISPQIYFLYILFYCSKHFFISFPVLSSDNSTITRVIVVDGNVVCFDLPKELTLGEREGSVIGRFVDRIDEETGRADKKGAISRCYIPQEYRGQIQDKLQAGAYIYLLKNIRRIKQTEWAIISAGTVIINKSEQSIGSGEGRGTPEPEPPIPTNLPSEPTQTTTTTTTTTTTPDGNFYYVDPVNGSDSGGNGSISAPWKTIAYALNNYSYTLIVIDGKQNITVSNLTIQNGKGDFIINSGGTKKG